VLLFYYVQEKRRSNQHQPVSQPANHIVKTAQVQGLFKVQSLLFFLKNLKSILKAFKKHLKAFKSIFGGRFEGQTHRTLA